MGIINKAIASIGSKTSVKKPIAAVGIPIPKNPLITPEIIKTSNK